MQLKKSGIFILFLLPSLIAIISTLAPIQAATQETIYGTDHDVGSPGNPTCLQCHIPHDAKGDYLWAMPPNYTYGTGLIPLCFNCHDGTITNKGQFITDTDKYNHKVTAGVKGSDCDRCHNPHKNTWEFLSTPTTDARFCGDCHTWSGSSHAMEGADTSKYPPADYTWDPYAAIPDYNGTRLWNSTDWQTWTNSAAGSITCMTCHTPHGAQYVDLTAMNSTGPGKKSPLCDNCH